MYPKDPYIVEGSVLRLHCALTRSYVAEGDVLNSSHMYFDGQAGTSIPLSRQYSFNESVLNLEWDNVYYIGVINCCLNKSSIGGDNRHVLDMRYIETGGKLNHYTIQHTDAVLIS